jgi:hypothetical protein
MPATLKAIILFALGITAVFVLESHVNGFLVLALDLIAMLCGILAFLVFREERPLAYERLLDLLMRHGQTSRMSATRTTTALAAFAAQRTRNRQAGTLFLLGALCLYVAVCLLISAHLSMGPVVLLAASAALLQLGDTALEYRIRRGLYGTTEYEARQIIQFLLANADDVDLSGSLGAADLILQPEDEPAALGIWGLAR